MRAAMNIGFDSEDLSNIKALQFETPRVAWVAGVEPQVLLGWRRRYNFLGGPKSGSQGLGGYRHSLIEIYVTRAVAMMIERGARPSDAIVAERKLVGAFTHIATTHDRERTVFVFHQERAAAGIKMKVLARNRTFGDIFDATPDLDAFIIVDLIAVMSHCIRFLKVRKHK
jgi:hypothetical protein